MQSSLFVFPGLYFQQLDDFKVTCLCLSTSETLTMWPNEGMTLMLMLLSER